MDIFSLEPLMATENYPITSNEPPDFPKTDLARPISYGCRPGDLVGSLPAGIASVAEATRNAGWQDAHQTPMTGFDHDVPKLDQPRSLDNAFLDHLFGLKPVCSCLLCHHLHQVAKLLLNAQTESQHTMPISSITTPSNIIQPMHTHLVFQNHVAPSPFATNQVITEAYPSFHTISQAPSIPVPPSAPTSASLAMGAGTILPDQAVTQPTTQQPNSVQYELPEFDLDTLLDLSQDTSSQLRNGEILNTSEIPDAFETSLNTNAFEAQTTRPRQTNTTPTPRKRRFPCPHEPCPRVFGSRNDLDRHLATRLHRGSASAPIVEYHCRVSWCKRRQDGFARKDHLARHMEKMHPGVRIGVETGTM